MTVTELYKAFIVMYVI